MKIPVFSLACLFLLLGFPGSGKAVTPKITVGAKPGWLNTFPAYTGRPNPRTVTNGFFYALVEEQVHVEKQAVYHRFIREIVSEAGIQNGSEVSVDFNPAYEQLQFHEIRVWRNNRAVDRLNIADFKVLASEEEQ